MTLDVEKATSRFHPRGSKPSASISSRSCPASRPFSRACRRSTSSLIIVLVVHRLSFWFRWFLARISAPSFKLPNLSATTRSSEAPCSSCSCTPNKAASLNRAPLVARIATFGYCGDQYCHKAVVIKSHQKKNGSRTIMINDYNKQAATNCDNFLIVPSVSSRFWILLRLFSAFSSSSSTSICKSAILSTFGKRWLLGKHRNYSCCPYRHPSFSLRKSP